MGVSWVTRTRMGSLGMEGKRTRSPGMEVPGEWGKRATSGDRGSKGDRVHRAVAGQNRPWGGDREVPMG